MPDDLERSMHRNLLHGLRAVAGVLPEATAQDVGNWLLFDSGMGDASANQALVASDPAAAAAQLSDVHRWYEGRGVAHTLWLRANADRLALAAAMDEGYVEAMRQPSMLLQALPGEAAYEPSVVLMTVTDLESVEAYLDAEAEEPDRHERHRESDGGLVRALIGSDDIRMFVAIRDGKPVARAMSVISDGVAGLANIYVAPSERRRGLGTQITEYAINDSARLGATCARLESSEMGRSMYLRMGFREVDEYVRLTPPPT